MPHSFIDRALNNRPRVRAAVELRAGDPGCSIDESARTILVRRSWLKPWRMFGWLIDAMNDVAKRDDAWATRADARPIFMGTHKVNLGGTVWQVKVCSVPLDKSGKAEACCRSGVPMETLARHCRGEWSGKGLATLLAPADGGKACWHVREDADGRFGRAKSPDLLPIDWEKLNERQRATIRRRRTVLGEWLDGRAADFERGFTERQSTDAFVARAAGDGVRVSRGTLYRWLKAFQAVGLIGLSDARLVEAADGPIADPFVDELKRLYLKPRGWSKALCYAMACAIAEERGWSVPFGERQAANVLAAIPKKVAAYHREGTKAYNAKHGRHVVRDYSKLPSNGLWASDGYTMDVRATAGGKAVRPTLVTWMPAASST